MAVVAALSWQVAVAWAADSIMLFPPSRQPVAGQVTRVAIGVSADASFTGGTVQVKTKVSGACAASPSADSGTAARFEGNLNSLPSQGPFTSQDAVTALLVLRQGRNVICAWLLDQPGNVLAQQGVQTVALPPTRTLLRGWNPATSACRAITRSEAAQAIGVPSTRVAVAGGVWGPGLTTFEQQYSSSCAWSDKVGDRYVQLVLIPEQTRPTLAYAHKLYEETGPMTRTPGDCVPVKGIGNAACVFTGSTGLPGHGTILAVQGHLILNLTFWLVYPHTSQDTFARIHAEEQLLARKALARVALAHR